MHINKNNIRPGDFVQYINREMNDTFNGAVGEVLEIIDDPEDFAMMAHVRWSDGTTFTVPVNSLYPEESYGSQAA